MSGSSAERLQECPGAGTAADADTDAGVSCLYEDAELLVLDKPSGLLCVPGRGPDKQDCLSGRALQRWPDALVVHRLDQATSGLVVMARSLASQRLLSEAFAQRRVHKRYVAVVAGRPAAQQADAWQSIDLPIAADWERRPLRIIDALQGKPSQTLWRAMPAATEDQGTPTTRVQLQPVTGRTHQLRVHMAALGLPLRNDPFYPVVNDAAEGDYSRPLQLLARSLAFVDPLTDEQRMFESPQRLSIEN